MQPLIRLFITRALAGAAVGLAEQAVPLEGTPWCAGRVGTEPSQNPHLIVDMNWNQ